MTSKHFITFIISLFLLFTMLTFSIRHGINESESVPISSTEQEFIEYTDNVFKSQIANNAFSLHFYLKNPGGYDLKNVPVTLGSLKYDDLKSVSDYYLEQIQYLKKLNRDELSPKSQLTYDIYMYYMQNELDFSDLCLNYELLSPTVGFQAQFPILLSQYEFYNKSDVNTYLSLLKNVGKYFDDIIEFEKVKAENGYFMSTSCADSVMAQCNTFINADNNFLITDFPDRIKHLNLSAKEAENYVSLNRQLVTDYVISSYVKLANSLQELKKSCVNKGGLCHYKNGQSYYEYLVRTYTGSNKSVPVIEKVIKEQLEKDMYTLSSVSDTTNIAHEINRIDSADKLSAHSVLSELIDNIISDFPTPKTLDFKIKEVPDSLSPYLSPAFYITPPIDDADNNVIFINKISDYANSDLFTTLAHEGYPGHLYQTTYFNSTDPLPIRHLLDFGGYVEGWATYVELYSYKYLYRDQETVNYMTAGTSYSLGLYCLCDIGINYRGWDKKDTERFLSENGVDDADIADEIFEVMVAEPGNYMKYYVGYLEFMELKKEYQNMFGDLYSEKKFHSFILNIGPAPFPVIRKYLYDKR